MTSDRAARTQRARRWLAAGAFGLLVGIALSAAGRSPVGGWIATAAAGMMVVGLHTFGRLGPDDPVHLSPERKKKKRKRKKKARD